MKNIKMIAFDADDTLWVNETLFQKVEKQFCEILEPYSQKNKTHEELFKTEMQNLEVYGYGIKAFMLSMIETAIRITENKITSQEVEKIILLGKDLLNEPIKLLDNVELVLQKLQPNYKLILATKGDLLDQERKLTNSGLAKYFHHIEVMSDKQETNYQKLIENLQVEAEQFMMIGNSLKSDVLPVVNIGAKAVHIPFETTWLHEQVQEKTDDKNYFSADKIVDVLKILRYE